MTEPEVERRLRGWYRAQEQPVPSSLAYRVLRLPDSDRVAPRNLISPDVAGADRRPRRGALLLAATLLIGAASIGVGAVGSGLFVLPVERSPVDGPANLESGLVPRTREPLRSARSLAAIDACSLFARAVTRAGLERGSLQRDHGDTFWNAVSCVDDDWDDGFEDRHFFLHTEPTTEAGAERLLESVRLSLLTGCCYEFGGWIKDGPGRWIGQWTGESPTARPDFYVVATVSSDGEFFVVTGDLLTELRALADAVQVELEAEVG